jgi:hypothetical protein
MDSSAEWLSFQTTTQHSTAGQKASFAPGRVGQFFSITDNCENLLKILTLLTKNGINFSL